jgi:capsular polysaccharide biosynthesis protein
VSIPDVGRSPTIDRRSAHARPLRVGVLAGAIAAVSALVGIEVMPTRYAATSVVSLVPRPTAVTSADTVRLLGKKYVVVATSATIMQRVGDAIGAQPDELLSSTTANLDAHTDNLTITVVRSDRQSAVDAANAVADALVRRSRFDELAQVEVTSPASAGRVEVSPSGPLLRSAGAVGAVIVGVLAWLLVYGRSAWRLRGAWPRGVRQRQPSGDRVLLVAEGAP